MLFATGLAHHAIDNRLRLGEPRTALELLAAPFAVDVGVSIWPAIRRESLSLTLGTTTWCWHVHSFLCAGRTTSRTRTHDGVRASAFGAVAKLYALSLIYDKLNEGPGSSHA